MKKLFNKSLILLILLGFFLLSQPNRAVALENNEQEISRINELFEIYQITNDNVNRLVSLWTLIIGIFATFITAFSIFFIVKHILADKEIKEYKEAVKQNKLIIEKETKEMLKEIQMILDRLKTKEENAEKIVKKIEGSKPSTKASKEVKEALAKLKKEMEEIEKIKQELAFQKGKLSISSTASTVSASDIANMITRPIGSASGICPDCGHPNIVMPGGVTNICSRCGKVF